MLKNAVDVNRNYLEKHYPVVIKRIVSAINSAIESDQQSVTTYFTKSEWNRFNFVDVEWYLNSFEYKCKCDTDSLGFDDFGYTITVEWYIE